MKIFQDVFIGVVDILGYNKFEASLKRYPVESSQAIMKQFFTSLETKVNGLREGGRITWTRYGDGFVFYSQDSDIKNLSEMVKKSSYLLASCLIQFTPLRIAITQGTLHVDNPENGTTISGQGWEALRRIENSLNWMGGLLYLPNYDGSHAETVQSLIQTTYLVMKQISGSVDVHFNPPVKENMGFQTDKTWFLNWQKCFRQPKSELDACIENWWSQPVYDNTNKVSDDVKEKQKNSIIFADYCRALNQASNLIYFSEIYKNIDISTINGV